MTQDLSTRVPADQLWDLVAAAQGGSPEAFGHLYTATVNRVYRFVYLQVRHQQTAEDITAETYVRGLRSLDRLVPIAGSPIAWLYTIARRLTADHFRSHAVTRVRTVGDFADLGDLVDLVESDVEGAIDAGRVLWEAVSRLPHKQLEVLLLRFSAGLSIAETAAAVGVNVDAVKSRQFRAVRALALDPEVRHLAA